MNKMISTIIHVPTEKEFNELMQILEKAGYYWCSGHKPTALIYIWTSDKKQTCIHIDKFGKLAYADKKWYSDGKFDVLSLAEYKNLHQSKKPSKSRITLPKILHGKEVKALQEKAIKKGYHWIEGLDQGMVDAIMLTRKPSAYWVEAKSYIYHKPKSKIWYCISEDYITQRLHNFKKISL